MKRSIKVPRIMFIASAVVRLVIINASPLQAQADTGRLAIQQQRLSVDKKKKQDKKAAPMPRDPGSSPTAPFLPARPAKPRRDGQPGPSG